jgi:hypothetical protein
LRFVRAGPKRQKVLRDATEKNLCLKKLNIFFKTVKRYVMHRGKEGWKVRLCEHPATDN